jgi:hypothetical protein
LGVCSRESAILFLVQTSLTDISLLDNLRTTMLHLGVIADLVMMLNSEFRNQASESLADLADYGVLIPLC